MSKQVIEYTRTVRQQVIRSRVAEVESHRQYVSRDGLYEVDTYVDGDVMARMRATGMLDDLIYTEWRDLNRRTVAGSALNDHDSSSYDSSPFVGGVGVPKPTEGEARKGEAS